MADEEFTDVLDFIKRTRKEGEMNVSYCCEGFLGHYEGEVRNHFFSCNAGLSVGSVLVDGSISVCLSIRSDLHQGNIYKDNFMDVGEHRFQNSVIANGCIKVFVLIVISSAIVKVMVCICGMTKENCCFVILRNCVNSLLELIFHV